MGCLESLVLLNSSIPEDQQLWRRCKRFEIQICSRCMQIDEQHCSSLPCKIVFMVWCSCKLLVCKSFASSLRVGFINRLGILTDFFVVINILSYIISHYSGYCWLFRPCILCREGRDGEKQQRNLDYLPSPTLVLQVPPKVMILWS